MEMELGKLFIGGLSWDTNEERLREYFQSFGEVMEAVIMKDRATGRARGFGFVVFADPAVAERVLMEKHLIDGRHVEAKKAVPREDQNIMNRNSSSSCLHGSPGPARTKKIFVGGLASTVTESDFKKYFSQFGIITDVVVMYDHNTQRPRGFGFITYDSEEAVDKVLRKVFHELNGKMVEVKRAVPKELSPGPTRSQLSGYNNYSPGRVGSIMSSYTQGYNPNAAGGLGVRLDGRFSPVTVGRSNFSPLGHGFGMGVNFEQGLSSSYGGNPNISSNLVYGRLSPSYSGNSNKYDNHIGYNGSNGGNSSVLNPTARALWGNESIINASSSTNSSFMVSGTGNSGMSSFGSFGGLWGSSSSSGQSGGAGSAFNNGSLGYNSGDISVGLGGIGYGRSRGTSAAPFSSYTVSDDAYDRPYSDIYENASMYGGSAWQSSPLELEGSASFGFGLGSAASDVVTKNSAGYVGGYSVSNRQANRGIAA
ncbi:heterogeneous nuclear ribonucleoprotein 1-like [Mercurialis annua]|uniref:heterogeneous nuclear ribonucleoprotein 1-like n=1 Tax=Mercurialis annua TaxID=3986 RepID=UPI00215E83A7|nr:heterogeneous nuclear ribonucleoprotein 1-like [Mercurialis annua]